MNWNGAATAAAPLALLLLSFGGSLLLFGHEEAVARSIVRHHSQRNQPARGQNDGNAMKKA